MDRFLIKLVDLAERQLVYRLELPDLSQDYLLGLIL